MEREQPFSGEKEVKFFYPSKTTLGLDIGSHSVKAVQLLKEGSAQKPRIRLLALGVAEIDQGNENPFEAIVPAINSALKDCELKKTRLTTSLAGGSMVIKQISLPSSSYKEIESSLKWEASQHIPMPLDKVEVKFQVRKVNKDQKSSEVLLVAVNKEHLQNHLDLLSQVQLQPFIVDAHPLALANAYLAVHSDHEDKNIAIIDIGASTTVMILFRKGGFFFTRDIALGGNRFTKEIQGLYHLDYSQAELFKKEEKVDLDQVRPILDKLLFEIRQSLFFYDTKTGNNGYEEITVTGGGAKLVGLPSFLEKNLSLPVSEFKPVRTILSEGNFPENEREKAELQLGVAVGLALRG